MRVIALSVFVRTLGLVLSLLGSTVFAAPGQNELTVRPLPFQWAMKDVDHPCGLLLAVKEERYDKKASEVLASANTQSSDAVAYQVIGAMANKDSELFRRLLLDPKAKRLDGFDVAKFLTFCDMPDDPLLMRVYRLGKASLYVFKGRRPVVMPILITPHQGTFFLDIPGENDPLCGMVVALNQAIDHDASLFAPVKDLTGYQSIDLPPVFADEDREHGARLYFKGMKYVAKVYPLDADAIEQLPTTNTPSMDAAIRFYARAWNTLAAGDIDAFACMLSKKDGDFVRKAGAQKMMEFFVGRNRSPRQINYILYSADVFWMVRQFSTGPYAGKQLIYDMVIWDNAVKEYKLVRVFPHLDALTSLTQSKGVAQDMIDKVINAD